MIKYLSKTQYVDIETGELLTKDTAKTNYKIYKKEKKVVNNRVVKGGNIQCHTYITVITNICVKKQQLKLEL